MAQPFSHSSSPLVAVGLLASVWCFFHSLFVSHRWRDFLQHHFPRYHVFSRLTYVLISTMTFAVMMLWFHTLPEKTVFIWSGWWGWIRWIGLAEAVLLFWLGVRSYDNSFFLGITQALDHFRGPAERKPPFRDTGILAVIRHPWYTGTLILLVFLQDYTDVNLVWRTVFLLYVLVGTELEERKLLRDLGQEYAVYRARVPRFFPDPRELFRGPSGADRTDGHP